MKLRVRLSQDEDDSRFPFDRDIEGLAYLQAFGGDAGRGLGSRQELDGDPCRTEQGVESAQVDQGEVQAGHQLESALSYADLDPCDCDASHV